MERKYFQGTLLLCFVSIFILQFLSYPSLAASRRSSFGKKFGGGLRKVSTRINKAVSGVDKVVNSVNEIVEGVNNVVDNVNNVRGSINQVFSNNAVGYDSAYECDPRGTLRIDGDQCVCKANVEGSRCDQCKERYFYLNKDIADGCIQCACGESQASGCMTVKREYSAISLLQYDGQITDINEVPLGIPITRHISSDIILRNGITKQYKSAISFPISGSKQSFWRADLKGDYTSSYGAYILFDGLTIIPFELYSNKTKEYGPKIVLVSDDGTRIGNSYERSNPESYFGESWFQLEESYWHFLPENVQDLNDDYEKTPVSRLDMINILINLRSVMLRTAIYYPHIDGQFQLNFVQWPVSSLSDQGEESMLEVCQCNKEYEGPLCEHCAPGYYPKMDADGGFIECARSYSYGGY